MTLAFFCDFDDTITRVNVTDSVLERFADPAWLEIQENWLAGKLGAREVLEKQMPLLSISREDLDAFVDSVEVDPFFAPFALFCSQNNFPLHILSDGFDYWIERILRRALAAVEGRPKTLSVFSCGLEFHGNQLAISFPYFPEGCIHGCATCKPGLFDRLKANGERAVVIGDGVSDLLLAKKADMVLAKNGLAGFCRARGIAFQAFSDFRDVLRIISELRSQND